MGRLAVTVGLPRSGGEPVVLRGPDRDYQGHREYLKELSRTLPAGRDEVIVMATGTSNGVGKRIRVDLSAIKGASCLVPGASDAAEKATEGATGKRSRKTL